MGNAVDRALNRITMYRLVVYALVFVLVAAMGLGAIHVVPYNPFAILVSTLFVTAVCVAANKMFARAFNAATNVESVYITALILALIISPPTSLSDSRYVWLALWASLWAIASKYMFAVRKKHVLNPAALGVTLTGLSVGLSASWWVGTLSMLPFVLMSGVLIARKLRRSDLVWSFLTVAVIATLAPHSGSMSELIATASRVLFSTPLFFFAFVMITEPLTTPPKKLLRIGYGAFVGLLFAPWIHLGSVYSTPELALLAGNIFSYLVSPKQKLVLCLVRVEKAAADTFDFLFKVDEAFSFAPGQYLEWTLSAVPNDSRGNRRYFTIASSPAEALLRVGIKFYPKPSGFKRGLAAMHVGDSIVASQLSGEFVLPKDRRVPLVFIAGGIGVTPFRSMVQYLLDQHEQRTVTMLYSNRTADDIAYSHIFDAAGARLGMETVYTLTDPKRIPPGWNGRVGPIDAAMIRETVPDYLDRKFYLSGPHGMVTSFEETLHQMGIPRRHIKIDFFPGFA